MAYTGNTPTSQGFTPAVDYFNGDGVTVAFTLSRVVLSSYQVEVVVDNVVQNPSSAYNILNSVITFTGAPLVGTNNVWIRYVALNSALTIVQPGAVGTPQLGNINTIVSATSLVLKTNSGVAALTIDANQNVGIGTSSPSAYGILTTVGNVANYASTLGTADTANVSVINNSVAGLGVKASLSLNIAGLGKSVVAGYYAAFNGSNDIGTGLQFGTQTNAAGGVVERMRIDSSGNVKLSTAATTIQNSSGNPILKQTGSVLQVVSNTYTGYATTSSTTFVATSFTSSITPSSSTNKILVMASSELYAASSGCKTIVGLFKNGVQVLDGFLMLAHNSAGTYTQSMVTGQYLDSPASTSNTVYTLYLKIFGSAGGAHMNPDGYPITVTLMEIVA